MKRMIMNTRCDGRGASFGERRVISCLLFFLSCFLTNGYAEESGSTARDKAQELHRLASSDVVYQDQEIKAIYYQNEQMIELLKQVRDILDSRLKEKSDSSN